MHPQHAWVVPRLLMLLLLQWQRLRLLHIRMVVRDMLQPYRLQQCSPSEHIQQSAAAAAGTAMYSCCCWARYS